MFILFIFFLIGKSQLLEWNCNENKHLLSSNDHFYEQCTITVEYLSLQQQQRKQICITHRLTIKNLPLYSFSSNYTMHTLKINSCQLLTLNQLPFTLPSTVEKVDLSYNLLSTFTLSFPLPSYLKYLYLDHNPNLIKINFGHEHLQQQLIGLSLRHNQHIQISSLPINLTQLDLTNCNLSQSSILSLLKSLTKLTHLSLAENQLQRLPAIDKRIQFKYLNLSNNQLTYVENRWLHKSLQILDLKFNQIRSLEFFHEKLKIKQILKQHNYEQTMFNQTLQLFLHGNPLNCDCWLASILDSTSINITDLSLLQCNSHPIMNISHSDFLCPYSRHCATDCFCCDFEACDCHFICPSECSCAHNSKWSQHIVQCQQANLSNMHILLPETITELNYGDNNIQQIEPYLFVGKTFLIKLNLAKNNIKHFNNSTFCSALNLREINLSYNQDLKILLSTINELFACLKYLQYIILSKEQIYNQEQINDEWMIDSNNDLIRLKRRTRQLSSMSTSTTSTIDSIFPQSTTIHSILQSEMQSTTLFSIYNQRSLTSSSFLRYKQALIIIIFFLLLFILLFLLLLIPLTICRHKLRRRLATEPQGQQSRRYYCHTNLHQLSMKIPDNNGITGTNDSLYEQLPSLSSDSEQPFLYKENKSNTTNPPVLPPYPPFRHYRCCHSINSHEYHYTGNISTTRSTGGYSSSNSQSYQCPAVVLLKNHLLCPTYHECSCELQPCLFSNQQENNSMHCCNNKAIFVSTSCCQCNSHMQNIDTYIYRNVNK